jgi:hypothetical protein
MLIIILGIGVLSMSKGVWNKFYFKVLIDNFENDK